MTCFRFASIGVLMQQPIDDFFLVEGDGIVTLGPAYGVVRVEGMTTAEAAAEIRRALRGFLPKSDGDRPIGPLRQRQDISRDYAVAPDGVIHLSAFRRGPSRRQDRDGSEAGDPGSPRPILRFAGGGRQRGGYNSKDYYVIIAGMLDGREHPAVPDHGE